MKKTKLIIISVLTVFTVILILQNTQPVDTNILFFTITIARAALLLLMTLIGFAIGVFTVFNYTGKRNRQV